MIARLLPLLEASGKDTMRLPDPGRKRRRSLDALLVETPDLVGELCIIQAGGPRCDFGGFLRGEGRKHRQTLQEDLFPALAGLRA